MRGHRAIAWAWEARTRLPAAQVPPERWVPFRQRLGLAEYCLQEVVRREPANVTAWTGLITVARGQQLSADEQRRRFDAAVAHDPDNYRAHTAMLQNLCPKWGGSPEGVRAFAERAARDAGEGSRLGTLVALAHLEHWVDLDDAPGRDYIRSAAVRESLNDAARESVRHRRYVRRRDWALDANAFAVAFLVAGDDEAAAMQFLAIGDLVTEFPWRYPRRTGGSLPVRRHGRQRPHGLVRRTGPAPPREAGRAEGATGRGQGHPGRGRPPATKKRAHRPAARYRPGHAPGWRAGRGGDPGPRTLGADRDLAALGRATGSSS
ncbi:hypothetical protein [Dactylosporangium sp. NPDC048998]|uniref:hypothetical protein n=1 Tax=Dactylosporangium sp. NPDC048998 TaxID=3363976 RepID=UPI003717E63A